MNSASTTPKSASLVFCYFGDDKYTTLAQETLKLKKAMEGYDRKILLKHKVIPAPFDLSTKDEKIADVIDTPTRANLVKYLKQLAAGGYVIDFWIFSHGARNSFLVSGGEHGQNVWYTAQQILADLAPGSGAGHPLPLRMVWSTLCYGATLNETWRTVGAQAVAGSRGINWFPHQFGRFADEWARGTVDFQTALKRADTAASRTLSHVYISTVHAPSKRKEWGGCAIGKTVLGKDPCSREYFRKIWGIRDDEYPAGFSGKDYMNHSSEKLVAGDGRITRRTVLVAV